jgi:hypothetical protein
MKTKEIGQNGQEVWMMVICSELNRQFRHRPNLAHVQSVDVKTPAAEPGDTVSYDNATTLHVMAHDLGEARTALSCGDHA